MTKKPETHNDDAETFDIYHFCSRFDVIAIALIILGLLLYNIYVWALAPLSPA